jgi:hypothetical protein
LHRAYPWLHLLLRRFGGFFFLERGRLAEFAIEPGGVRGFIVYCRLPTI